jgi:hypothetical protein
VTRFRGAGLWVAIAAALVAVALLTGRPPRDGDPLDPSATGPAGTKALVLVLKELGADVTVATEPPSATSGAVTLLLVDTLDDADASALDRWVRSGGTLVVTDPRSRFAPPVRQVGLRFGGELSSDLERGACGIPALARVDHVDPEGGVGFDARAGTASCFGDERTAFVVARDHGAGTVVAIGGAGVFTNAGLDDRDNSVLAASLLAPRDGTDVSSRRPPAAGPARRSLYDLVSPRVKQALLQLAVAFVLYALWRARRLGRPVAEPLPVPIPGSELTRAVGQLLQQQRRPEQAAEVLRADLRRTLAQRLGLPPDAPDEVVADAAAARSGIDRDAVWAALAGAPSGSEGELVALARLVDNVRLEVVHGRR